MAKANRLPSVERSYPTAPPTTRPAVAETAVGEVVTVPQNVEQVVIELPIGPRSKGYLNDQFYVRLTTNLQQVAMQRLVTGLIESRAVLKDGTKVGRSEQHAVRWLLENLPILSD